MGFAWQIRGNTVILRRRTHDQLQIELKIAYSYLQSVRKKSKASQNWRIIIILFSSSRDLERLSPELLNSEQPYLSVINYHIPSQISHAVHGSSSSGTQGGTIQRGSLFGSRLAETAGMSPLAVPSPTPSGLTSTVILDSQRRATCYRFALSM